MSSIGRNPSEIYKSDPKLKPEDVKIIQEWLKKQPHLPQLLETHILLVLHSCYYSVETTKTCIETYFTKRTQGLEYFQHLPEEELRRTLSCVLAAILPKKTQQGYVVCLVRLLDFNPENFLFPRTIRLLDMIIALYYYTQGPSNGLVAVFDAQGFTLGHLTRFNLTILKHALDYLQEGAPIRIKGIHIINAVPILDKVLSLIKPFMKGELFSLIQIHSSFETFFKYVPKECFPEDYGGDLPSCQMLQETSLENLLQNVDYFKYNDSLQIDESKRLEKSNLHGLQGTFKKLEID